ncbi:MAG: hypothetical protein M3507_07190 [Actinomycetota bacterium]|nr:hypothetical protein [Actinomycetota bacterium]
METGVGTTLADLVAADPQDGYTEEQALHRVRVLDMYQAMLRLAPEVLDERERDIWHRTNRGDTVRSISEDYPVSEQRIGQIRDSVFRKLTDAARADPKARHLFDPDEGGTT